MNTKLKGEVRNGELIIFRALTAAPPETAVLRPPGRPLSASTPAQGFIPKGPQRLTRANFELLAVKVADLCGSPLRSLDLVERFGRVHLVSFVPFGAVDPVLPMTLFSLGNKHDDAWRRLAGVLMSWNPRETHPAHWFNDCRKYARICVRAAVEQLGRGEAEYYGRKMFWSFANPNGRKLSQKGEF